MTEKLLGGMTEKILRNRGPQRASAISCFAVLFTITLWMPSATAQNGSAYFSPGNLVVSRSVYDNNPSNVQVGMTLPPSCVVSTGSCVTATNDGTYPYVWNNAASTGANDASFGITSKIFLDQMTPAGVLLTSLEVPNSSQNGVPPTKDQMVTSFPPNLNWR